MKNLIYQFLALMMIINLSIKAADVSGLSVDDMDDKVIKKTKVLACLSIAKHRMMEDKVSL